ncbi:MAG: copper homeostasis protein CutC [Verrucomicrobia bacterium]|nr:copper homeostasis protein CutC [Verrucomicrobiota bacterium]MBI3866973.1 copper homeostasis protein CutC [Verrucomicrobiota bacterium]
MARRSSARPLIEICVDSVESAIAAEAGGADRVELCQNLFEGGTTPSLGMIETAAKRVRLPVFVIIRPRGADFCYSDHELDVMAKDVAAAKMCGAAGIVTGILRPNGAIDERRMQSLIQCARPLPVTFHRAFDMVPDPMDSLERLITLGVERVLTSGQEKSVLEGSELIQQLVKAAGKRIVVMPGGGITDRNFARIRKLTGASEFHLSASHPVASRMTHRNDRAPMGRELRAPEYGWSATDPDRVRRVVGLAKCP